MAKTCSGCPTSGNKDWEAESDAGTLSRSQEIRNDEKRHKAALAYLKKQSTASAEAVSLETKVKKGLAAAFPKETK